MLSIDELFDKKLAPANVLRFLNSKFFKPFELVDKVIGSRIFSYFKFSSILLLTGISSDFIYEKYKESVGILEKIESRDEHFRKEVVTPIGVKIVDDLV